MKKKMRVLILCTGNSCRSQMAEGWVNHELGETCEARSAGTRPAESVHPLAVRVMADAGVDISGARPRDVAIFLNESWDLVVTVCDSARESCPTFPQTVESIHVSFPDPAAAEGSEDEVMRCFTTVRDSIHDQLLPEIRFRTV